jgi:hypothetical protein
VTPYDVAAVAKLCQECRASARNKSKGEAMADLTQHVFSAIDGLQLIERGLLSEDKSTEIDLIYGNSPQFSGMPTSGVTIFVECKNERRKISASQVRNFGAKLRTRNQRFGIMVTATGLSGGSRSHAHAAVAQELADGRTIVVITMADIKSLQSPDDLVALCVARCQELEVYCTYKSI